MSDNGQRDTPYEVGYGKPPAHGRFRPGQSGNPKGRPKARKNFKTELAEELDQKITIQENGVKRRITKRVALLKSQINKGIKGDTRATQLVMSLFLQMVEREAGDEVESLTPEELAVMESYIKRQAAAARDGQDAAPDARTSDQS